MAAWRKALVPNHLSISHLVNDVKQIFIALSAPKYLLPDFFSGQHSPFIATKVNVNGHWTVGRNGVSVIKA